MGKDYKFTSFVWRYFTMKKQNAPDDDDDCDWRTRPLNFYIYLYTLYEFFWRHMSDINIRMTDRSSTTTTTTTDRDRVTSIHSTSYPSKIQTKDKHTKVE